MFLEGWYHQKDCDRCGEQLCWLDGDYRESDGTPHRCPTQRPPTPPPKEPIPEKPTWELHPGEWEKRYKGQKELESWF